MTRLADSGRLARPTTAPRAVRVGAAAGALVLAACAGQGRVASPTPVPAPARGDTTGLADLYAARLDSAKRRFTPADAEFMRGMIHHHAQAVAMSAWAEPNGASPTVRTLAARITNAQRDEIALMQRWLRDRGQPVPELHEMNGRVMVHEAGGHAGHGGGDMPGMLSATQLAELRAARGPTFDRLFLTFMIQHHRGAVTMVRALFATDGAGQDEAAFKFASDVQVDQSTEVARMELMLRAMASPSSAGPTPPPAR